LAAAAMTALWASWARAEGAPSLDLRGFHPPTDPAGGLNFEPASSPASFDFNTSLWWSYALSPATLRDPVADEVANRVIAHQLSGDFVLNVGIAERMAVGIDLPFVAYQTGDAADAQSTAVLGDYRVPSQAFGDLKLVLKGTIIQPTNDEFGGFALALTERLGIPTGDEYSYLGEGHVTSDTRVLAEYRYVALGVHGSLGFRARAEQEAYGCASIAASLAGEQDAEEQLIEECGTSFGHEIPFGLALSLWPQALELDPEGRWLWFVETYGYVPAGPQVPFSNALVAQVQIGAGARYRFYDDLSLLAGVDAALVPGIGTAPLRATLALQWAPRKHDADDDGVRDEDDECPEEGLKEDIDGYQDDDGCPDWDNDDDGVPDDDDRCAMAKEDVDGFLDADGCPDPDNDEDGIVDVDDHCPDVPGIASSDLTQRGCPDRDPDRDGVQDDADQCPNDKEDKDGHQDADGCPDPDNDGDGFADADDACPDLAGVPIDSDPSLNGCPDTDADGIIDGKDACREETGVPSEDPAKHGCPAPTGQDDGEPQ